MKLKAFASLVLVLSVLGCSKSEPEITTPDYAGAKKIMVAVNDKVLNTASVFTRDFENVLPVIDNIMDSKTNMLLDAIELAQIQDFAKPYLKDGKLHLDEYAIIREEIYRLAYISNATGSEKRALLISEGK